MIRTYPPGARVLVADLQYVGLTGQPLTSLEPGTYSLTLRLENHEPLNVTVSGNDFAKGVYPPSGVLELTATTWTQAAKNLVRYKPAVVLGTIITLLLLGLGGRVASRRHKRQVFLESFSPPVEGSRSLVMETVGGYRVVDSLGEGGMAEVYLAVPNDSLDMEKSVAIKVMAPWLRDRPEFVERFEREIKVCSRLAHPGIVETLDWGWKGERLYMVMEHIPGQLLSEKLPELVGDWSRLRETLSQLMQAVDYAHQQGVAHRDLKPENVMLTPDWRVKVMDFGLARAVDSKTLTDFGAALGTPKYIAPESIVGKGADERADQYTLGVMAYEMLVGRLPFLGEAVPMLLYSHGNLEPPKPTSLAPHLPPEVDSVLSRMMAKAPRDRYRTVEEARVALLAALEPLYPHP